MQSSEHPDQSELNPTEASVAADNDKITGISNDATIQTGAKKDPSPNLEHLLKEAEIKAAEHHDAWIRAKAETENIRKRLRLECAPQRPATVRTP